VVLSDQSFKSKLRGVIEENRRAPGQAVSTLWDWRRESKPEVVAARGHAQGRGDWLFALAYKEPAFYSDFAPAEGGKLDNRLINVF